MADPPSYAELTPEEAARLGQPATTAPPVAPAPVVEAPPATLVVERAGQQFTIDARKATRFLGSGFELAPTQYQNGGQGVPVAVDGQIRFLPSEEASRALRSFDAMPASVGQALRADELREHQTLGGKLRTAAGSLYSGVTGGLGDVVVTGLDDAVRATIGSPDDVPLAETLRLDREANPGVDQAFQLGGMGLGLVGGGALGAGFRGLTAAGEGAGYALGRGAVALGAREGGILARGVAAAGRGATEFAGLEVGQELSREALAQQGYDADRLLVAAGHGALMGAALGGAGSLLYSTGRAAVGYGADLAGRAYEAGAERLGGLVERGTEAGRNLIARGESAGRGFLDRGEAAGRAALDRGEAATLGAINAGESAVVGGVAAGREALGRGEAFLREGATRGAEVGRGLAGRGLEVGRDLLGRGEGYLREGWARLEREGVVDRVGREQAIKSTGANLPQIEKLRKMVEANPDLEDRVVRKILDDLTEGAEHRIVSRSDMAAKAEQVLERDGKPIGEMVRELSGAGVRTDIDEWVSTQRRRVIDQLGDTVNPDLRRGASQIEDWFAGIQKKSKGDPLKLWETKRDIGRQINWKAGTDDAYNELKKDLYFSLDREITRLGTESASKMGDAFAARWRAANQEYQAARWIRDATAKGAAAELRNRGFGLSEQLGALGGLAFGGPLAAPVGAAAQHFARRYGSQVLSQALLRPDALRLVVGQVDAQIRTVARQYVAQATAIGRTVAGRVGEARGRAGAAVGRAAARASAAVDEGQRRLSEAADEARVGVRGGAADARTRLSEAAAGGRVRLSDVADEARASLESGRSRARGAIDRTGERLGTARERLSEAADEAARGTGRLSLAGVAEADRLLREPPPRPRMQEYQERSQQLVAYQAHRAAQNAGQAPPSPLPPALVAATDRGAAYLATKLPQRPPVRTVAGMESAPPSPVEQAKYLRYARAVDDPLGAITGRQGPLSPEMVDALKEVHPSIYEQLVQHVQEAVAERDTPLTRTERRSLAALLQLPADPSRNPATVAAVQAALSSGVSPLEPFGAQMPQPPPAMRRPLSLPDSSTRSDQLAGDL